MDNIDEGNVIVNQNFEKSQSEIMICETTTEIDTIKQSDELNLNLNEQMEVSESKILPSENEVAQVTNNIAPTPQEIELTNKLRNFNTSTNPNNSALNILNEYGSSSEDDSEDSSSSESSDSSSSSESDEDEPILNVKNAAKLWYIKTYWIYKFAVINNQYFYSDDDGSEVKTNVNHFKVKGELDINELPPIEELKICVSEEECIEIGSITSIVDLLGIILAIYLFQIIELILFLFFSRNWF